MDAATCIRAQIRLQTTGPGLICKVVRIVADVRWRVKSLGEGQVKYCSISLGFPEQRRREMNLNQGIDVSF
jgi:hypothetical protein